uniref:Coat protein n=1 Tax=Leviviridae sp. TaxID=2027243 RepID=A0A514DC60_9VIRU|nr:MAG: hypothetical protein H4Bulk46320e3181_000002 [Leviviridae sp.]
MLSDPISYKVAGVATNHPRTAVGTEFNEYSVSDGTSVVRVGSSKTKGRVRKFVSKTATKVAADPISAVNQSVNAVVTVTLSNASFGFTTAELKALVLDAADFLTNTSGANTDKILGGER